MNLRGESIDDHDRQIVNALLAGEKLEVYADRMHYSRSWAMMRLKRLRVRLGAQTTAILIARLALHGHIVEKEDGTCTMA